MAERHDLLDAAIQALIDGATEIAIPRDLEPLMRIVADLRDLPDPEFRRRLGGHMTTSTPARAKILEATAYLVHPEAEGLIDFIKNVFDAEEVLRTKGGAGGLHCELRVEGSRLMIGGSPNATHGALHVFVSDVDSTYARALAAGAVSIRPPADQEYGSRDASINDAFGNQWYIATAIGTEHHPAGEPSLLPCFHPVGAGRMIDFLQSALGGELVERYDSPGGALIYAKVKLGATGVELGEAHGEFQPIPMMFSVAVDDADAAYARAIEQGAESIMPPSSAPYGRTSAVRDPFGNQWYLTAAKQA